MEQWQEAAVEVAVGQPPPTAEVISLTDSRKLPVPVTICQLPTDSDEVDSCRWRSRFALGTVTGLVLFGGGDHWML